MESFSLLNRFVFYEKRYDTEKVYNTFSGVLSRLAPRSFFSSFVFETLDPRCEKSRKILRFFDFSARELSSIVF